MKKITKIFKNLLIVSLLLLMTNCATEEIVQNNISQSSIDTKIWFDANKNNYNATVLNYINEIDWQNAIISNGDIGQVIEVPFTLSGNLSSGNKEANLYNDHHRLMFIKNKESDYQLFYVEIFSKEGSSKDINYYNIKDNFDGKIFVQELATNLGSKLEFKADKKTKRSIPVPLRYDEEVCVYYGYWYEDGHFEALYEVACYGGGSKPPTIPGSGTPGPGYGTGGGSGSSGGGGVVSVAQRIERQIKSDQLDPCTKAVFDRLKNLKNADIAKMIARFLPPASVFNLIMSTGQVKNNDPNVYAQTRPVKDFPLDVSMVFNQDYINGTGNLSPPTDLSVAATMAHEIIHAFLISQIQDYNSNGASGILDFPTIYETYVQQQISKDQSILPEAHHELIASQYVYAIAATIEEFQTGEPVVADFPKQIYLDLAWGGLTGTTQFNKTYPNDPNDKNYQDRVRIFARLNTERLGTVYGVNTPVGTPCKK